MRCLRFGLFMPCMTLRAQVRLHDDKQTYTGVHARGGPESVPKAGQLT